MINDELKTDTLDDIILNDRRNSPHDKNLHQQKIDYFKRKIVVRSAIFVLMVISVLSATIYHIKIQQYDDLKISNIKNQIDDLKKKSSDIKKMVQDATRFKLLWKQTDVRKKNFTEIKIASINEQFVALTKKYNISKPVINISVPEALDGGVWATKSLGVNLINFNITFEALTDVMAMDFLSDFINSLPSYVIINNFEIKKPTKGGYSDDGLIKISNGEFSGLVIGKIDFSWYYLKPKTISIAPPQ